MRNAPLADFDTLDAPVLPIGTDYPANTLLPMHRHRRAQFLYGMTGLMEVTTDDGAWVVPPYTGVWIPADRPHQVLMQGVSTRSLYIEPDAAPRSAMRCEVLQVSPLLHALLCEAVDIDATSLAQGRNAALLGLAAHEITRAPTLPLFAPLPRDPRLARRCRAFLHAPDIQARPAQWAAELAQSERTFTRTFRAQTGLAFGQWRQQACLMAALPRLTAGESVTRVALDLGYGSASAFTTMFRRLLGRAPITFVGRQAGQEKEP